MSKYKLVFYVEEITDDGKFNVVFEKSQTVVDFSANPDSLKHKERVLTAMGLTVAKTIYRKLFAS